MKKIQIISNLKELINNNGGALETVFFDENDKEALLKLDDLDVNFIEEQNGSIFFGAITKTGKNIYNNLESLSDNLINEMYFFIQNNIIC